MDSKGREGGERLPVAVQEISSTLFIDSDEVCIKSDFSVPFFTLSSAADLVSHEEVM